MAWRCGSLPRSLMSAARSSSSPFRSSLGLSGPFRPPTVSGPRVQSRGFSFASRRYLTGLAGGTIGCSSCIGEV